jgi:hypothetical protein
MQGHIVKELQNTDFMAIQANETTYVMLAIICRYIDAAKTVQERYWGFAKLEGGPNADTISRALLQNLSLLFPEQGAEKDKTFWSNI